MRAVAGAGGRRHDRDGPGKRSPAWCTATHPGGYSWQPRPNARERAGRRDRRQPSTLILLRAIGPSSDTSHSARSIPGSRRRTYSFRRQKVSIPVDAGESRSYGAGYKVGWFVCRFRLSSRACSSSRVRRHWAQIRNGTGNPSGPSTMSTVVNGCRGRELHSSQRAVAGSGNARCLMKTGNPGSSRGASRQEISSSMPCIVAPRWRHRVS